MANREFHFSRYTYVRDYDIRQRIGVAVIDWNVRAFRNFSPFCKFIHLLDRPYHGGMWNTVEGIPGVEERREGWKENVAFVRKGKKKKRIISTAYLVKRNILGFSLSIYGEGLTQLWTLVSPASGERNSFA